MQELRSAIAIQVILLSLAIYGSAVSSVSVQTNDFTLIQPLFFNRLIFVEGLSLEIAPLTKLHPTSIEIGGPIQA